MKREAAPATRRSRLTTYRVLSLRSPSTAEAFNFSRPKPRRRRVVRKTAKYGLIRPAASRARDAVVSADEA